jgi:hypothetical protein
MGHWVLEFGISNPTKSYTHTAQVDTCAIAVITLIES